MKPVPTSVPLPRHSALFTDLAELTKSRLTILVLFTTLTGFYLASAGHPKPLPLFHALLGTAAVAAGAAVLNQVLEAAADARMHRTKSRPIPAGRFADRDALCLGTLLSGFGLAYLFLSCNELTAWIAALTLFSYLFLYTPLKQITSCNTLIGAIPGALPPVIGWTAAGQPLNTGALALFLILFFWQMPHFLAIAWLYREDYARGGFRMLTRNDPDGRATAWKTVAYALAVFLVGLLPYVWLLCGPLYLAGSLLCGGAYLAAALAFARDRSAARRLFLASIVYLPVMLILLIADQL